MKHYTVIDTGAPTMSQKPPTAASILTAITSSPIAILASPYEVFDDANQQTFAQLSCQYTWHDKRNQQQAQKILKGALIAHQHQYYQQTHLYKQQLFHLITKDMAAAAQAAIQQHPLSYKNFLYWYPHEELTSGWQFTVPIQARGLSQQHFEWLYVPIEKFARRIPLHALEILELLEQRKLTPQAFWVADKVEIRHRGLSERRSLDPILCAQYGHWFLGIAQWD